MTDPPEAVTEPLLRSLADRRDQQIQLDRIERKLNALCRAVGGPLRQLDLSEPS